MIMRDECKSYHMDVLAQFNTDMFESLIYPHNISSDNLKEVEFKESVTDDVKLTPTRGYFARKEKIKYWIDEKLMEKLPIRVGKSPLDLIHKDDVVIRPTHPIPFKITPEHTISTKELIDGFAPFEHSNPDQWTLMKIIALAGYIGKTYLCISTSPHFGKTSIYVLLNGITDKVPVFKPRSVPGVLNQINGVGNMVFDEVQDCSKDVRNVMEEFSLDIGGNKNLYINGAMKASRTKSKYPCPLQSITYLYNNIDCYKNPEKEYYEMIFSNRKALDDRFLKLKLDGELIEKFDRNFNVEEQAKINKSYYIKVAKELLYLQETKRKNEYTKRFKYEKNNIVLSGRKKIIFDEVVWLLDRYCKDQDEYNHYINLIETAILDYKKMVEPLLHPEKKMETFAEFVR